MPGPALTRAPHLIGGVLIGALLAYEVGFFGGFFKNCAVGPVPLNVNGSSAFYPTAVAEAGSYHASCPVAFISVGSSSSGAGLHMLTQGNIQVANSELSAREAGYGNAGLVEHQVAVIVFGMVMNPSVTGVQSLTRAQITGIYAGTITNWNQIPGGPDLPIQTVGRPADSGTQSAFTRFVLQDPARQPTSPSRCSPRMSRTIRSRRARRPALRPVHLVRAGDDLPQIPVRIGEVAEVASPRRALERMPVAGVSRARVGSGRPAARGVPVFRAA